MIIAITVDDAIALRGALEGTRALLRGHPGHAHAAAREGARAAGAAVAPGVIDATLHDLAVLCERVISALDEAIDDELSGGES